MPKRPHKKQTYPPKQCFAYINDDGSQYLPEGQPQFAEIPEDQLPGDVSEFWVSIRVLPASYSINSQNAISTRMMEAQIGGRDANASAATASQEQTFQQLMMALDGGGWSLVGDNEEPIPISREALEALEPGWLYDFINAAYSSVNGMSKNWQTA